MTVHFDVVEKKFCFDNGLSISIASTPSDPNLFLKSMFNRNIDKDNQNNEDDDFIRTYEYFETELYEVVFMIERIDNTNIKFSLINIHYAWNSYDKYYGSFNHDRVHQPTFAEITIPIENCTQALIDFAHHNSNKDDDN
jgi:hypothetical protein